MMTKGARRATRVLSKISVRRGVAKAKRLANRLERRKLKQELREEADPPRKKKPIITEHDIA